MMQTAKGGSQRSSELKITLLPSANDVTIATMCNIGLSKSKGFMDLSADNAVIRYNQGMILKDRSSISLHYYMTILVPEVDQIN